MVDVLNALARLAVETKFEDLPEPVIHAAKRTLLDSIGCALASHSVDKGRMCIALSRKLGGPAEASIVGVNGKVSACNAALANGELINAMDYDPLFIPGGHVSPYVVPAALAMAESVEASGKQLIAATALAHEVAIRVTRAMSPMVQVIPEGPGKQRYKWTDPYGGSRYNLGAAAGVGALLKLDVDQMMHALALSGHHTQVGTHAKLSYSIPAPMTKYGTPGWQSTGAIISGLLAQIGYVGDLTLFEGQSGFWRFTGSEKWEPQRAVDALKDEWFFLEQQHKPYPSCRVTHACLDLLYDLMDAHALAPEEIERITTWGPAYSEKPHLQNRKIESATDAQFSTAYVVSLAVHKVTIGAEWQDPETMRDPRILEFMKRVTSLVHPVYTQRPLADRLMIMGRIEVVARGQTFVAEAEFAHGTPRAGFEMTDAQLAEKFLHNASRVLSRDKACDAVGAIMQLEELRQVSEAMSLVT